VCVAGRRFGKTRLACKMALHYALLPTNERGYDLAGMDVHYVAPTYAQAEESALPYLLEDAQDFIQKVNRQKGFILLNNGRRIWIKSSDRPDNLRGRKSCLVILDELKDMKPSTWDLVIRPMLVDVEGGALFIGTPSGKTGALYDIYRQAERGKDDWSTFHFKTIDNPYIAEKEVESAKGNLSKQAYLQEFEATFDTTGGSVLDNRRLKTSKTIRRGVYLMGVSLGSRAGMARNNLATAGESSAIALVLVHPLGWHIRRIERGHWGVAETLKRLFRLHREYRPRQVAIPVRQLEVIAPYLAEVTREFETRPRFVEVGDTEGMRIDRITWALQGRMKAGKVTAQSGERWISTLKDQMFDFPSEYAPLDALNALSFVDQLPQPAYNARSRSRFTPLDLVSGY